MNLRTLTFFLGEDEEILKKAVRAANALTGIFKPQTVRAVVNENFVNREKDFLANEVWGYSISFDEKVTDKTEKNILEALTDEKCFVNINLDNDTVDTDNIMRVSKVIKKCSKKDPTGMVGFRLGVGIGTPDFIPFFPYAKTGTQKENVLTIGLEMCQFLEELIEKNKRKSLVDLRETIIKEVTMSVEKIEKEFEVICNSLGVKYGGVDLSIAPFPYPIGETSISNLVQKIGSIGRSRSQKKFEFGNPGTLFVHTFLTDTLKEVARRGLVKTAGFNGMMYSLLEDNDLSKLYEENKVGYSELMMLSSTCGCGLDMVPVPESTSLEEISGYICDTFSLASILRKPLGVRLLVVPAGRPGDTTAYKHVFLSNTTLKKDAMGPQFFNLPNQKKRSTFSFMKHQK